MRTVDTENQKLYTITIRISVFMQNINKISTKIFTIHIESLTVKSVFKLISDGQVLAMWPFT